MSKGLRAYIFVSIAAFVAAAVWTGCGVKSPPIPLQYASPQRILDLHAVSEKHSIRLTWGRPVTYTGGATMRDLGSFLIMRASRQSPYQEVGRVEVTDQSRFQQQREFTYLDRGAVLGQGYSYEVISMTTGGNKSLPSNEVTIVRSIPPPPPNPENFVVPTPAPLP